MIIYAERLSTSGLVGNFKLEVDMLRGGIWKFVNQTNRVRCERVPKVKVTVGTIIIFICYMAGTAIGKERGNPYQKMKRSPDERHT